MHHSWCAHDGTAVDLADALVPQADAEHRHPALAEMADRVVGHAGILGAPRTGRHEHRVGFERGERVEVDGVVAVHDGLRAELTEVLDEVVDERVVVVDHDDARSHDRST